MHGSEVGCVAIKALFTAAHVGVSSIHTVHRLEETRRPALSDGIFDRSDTFESIESASYAVWAL